MEFWSSKAGPAGKDGRRFAPGCLPALRGRCNGTGQCAGGRPNRTFLRYIAQVLPSLGEHAVVQTTFADLVPEVVPAADAVESPPAERVKGDGRMAEVLRRAVTLRFRRDEGDIEVPLGLRRLVVRAAEANAAVDSVAPRGMPYSKARELLRDQFVTALYERYVDLAGPPTEGSELGRRAAQCTGPEKRPRPPVPDCFAGDPGLGPAQPAQVALGCGRGGFEQRRAAPRVTPEGPSVDGGRRSLGRRGQGAFIWAVVDVRLRHRGRGPRFVPDGAQDARPTLPLGVADVTR